MRIWNEISVNLDTKGERIGVRAKEKVGWTKWQVQFGATQHKGQILRALLSLLMNVIPKRYDKVKALL